LRAELFPWLAMQTFVSACFEHSADLAFLSSAESPALPRRHRGRADLREGMRAEERPGGR
jgi:hypothetical protein